MASSSPSHLSLSSLIVFSLLFVLSISISSSSSFKEAKSPTGSVDEVELARLDAILAEFSDSNNEEIDEYASDLDSESDPDFDLEHPYPEEGEPEEFGGDETSGNSEHHRYHHHEGESLDEDTPPLETPLYHPDVVELAEGNFSEFLKSHQHAMVQFYAPWCGHCHSLAPEYAAAATQLKELGIPLAKVDATAEYELGQSYNVEAFPTILFFIDGNPKPYTADRTQEAIVSWVKKKLGPAVTDVTSVSDATAIVESGKTVVVAFFEKLEGPEVEEFASVARQEDDILFYQTTKEEVAHVFSFKKGTKAPSLVVLKKTNEKITHYDGEFVKGAISEFVQANKLPLVVEYSMETASLIFENPIKYQMLLFLNPEEDATAFSSFEEASKYFKGKIIFVRVNSSDEEISYPIMEYFGVAAVSPAVVGYTIPDDQSTPRKFYLEGEITAETVKAFAEDFLANKLKQVYKSDPIPEKNDGDVTIVVGKNFEEIVLDESKDVLLEIYAPWCGHCQALESTYNKLGRVFRGIESMVIAKMDGTTNEHDRATSEGFPTLLFFPAGKKSSEPITVDAERNVKAFYQFLKEHATIPFTLPEINKPGEEKAEKVTTSSSVEDGNHQPKDEL